MVSVYLDGTLIGSAKVNSSETARSYIGIHWSACIAHFRNVKLWELYATVGRSVASASKSIACTASYRTRRAPDAPSM